MRRKLTALAIAPVLLLAACGGDDSGEAAVPTNTPLAKKATATPTPTPTPEETAAPKGAAKDVAIEGFAYAPTPVTAKVGDTITWSNADAAPHTVTATSGGDLDSGSMAQGASFEFTAEEAGTIEYFCEIHPSMKGSIEISS